MRNKSCACVDDIDSALSRLRIAPHQRASKAHHWPLDPDRGSCGPSPIFLQRASTPSSSPETGVTRCNEAAQDNGPNDQEPGTAKWHQTRQDNKPGNAQEKVGVTNSRRSLQSSTDLCSVRVHGRIICGRAQVLARAAGLVRERRVCGVQDAAAAIPTGGCERSALACGGAAVGAARRHALAGRGPRTRRWSRPARIASRPRRYSTSSLHASGDQSAQAARRAANSGPT